MFTLRCRILTFSALQAAEEENVLPAVDMKEEVLKALSCSAEQLGGWSGTFDGEDWAVIQKIRRYTL